MRGGVVLLGALTVVVQVGMVGVLVRRSVLIVFMVLVVLLIQLVVGRRRLGRRAPTTVSLEGIPA